MAAIESPESRPASIWPSLVDAVRKPVLAHELPDIFLAVELGCARWQRQERDVARNPEIFRAVPAGLIEDENGMRAGGDLRGDLLEMKLHGFAVAGRQHERGAQSTTARFERSRILSAPKIYI